jgi:hypothetical protein
MSNHAARSAKRAKVAVEVPNVAVEVPNVAVPEVPKAEPLVDALVDARAERARLEGHLDVLEVRDEVPRFSLVFPPAEWAKPFTPLGAATFAAVYFHFGPDSIRNNTNGIPDRDPVFINLAETRTIRGEEEIRRFLLGAATVADAHNRIRRLRELAALRALLGDAAPAPLGTIFWHTQYGLQVEYGRHTEGGCRFEPSPASTARFSIYATRWCACAGASPPAGASAPARVLLAPDALAAKCAAFAPKRPPPSTIE